jgi:hypothetical protein
MLVLFEFLLGHFFLHCDVIVEVLKEMQLERSDRSAD